MKRTQILGLMVSSFIMATSTVYAQGQSSEISFTGRISGSLFGGQTIRGFCDVDPAGDMYKQTTLCRVESTKMV